MVMFLGSEIMLFGSFFTIFFYIRFTHTAWPPPGIELPVEATGINTAILISSSFTMHWALVSIKRDQRFGLIVGLFLTLAMGLTFLSLQVHEYLNLGLHAVEQRLRLGLLLAHRPARHARLRGRDASHHRLLRACRGHYSGAEHIGLEVTGLYWHFVDVVWILLYTVVYLL